MQARVGAEFQTQPLGTLSLKGKTEAVHAYSLEQQG